VWLRERERDRERERESEREREWGEEEEDLFGQPEGAEHQMIDQKHPHEHLHRLPTKGSHNTSGTEDLGGDQSRRGLVLA